MENENKNHHKHWGKKNYRPKSYFIEPPAGNNGDAAVQQQKPAENTPKAQNTARDNGDRKPQNKHHNKQSGGEHFQRSATEPQKENQVNDAVTGAQATAEQGQSQGKKRKKRRPKNKNKGEQNGQPTPDTAQSVSPIKNEKRSEGQNERPQKKKYERPQTRPQGSVPTDINEADYERISFPSASEERTADIAVAEKKDSPMIEVVGIRFKSTGKTYYFSPGGKKLRRGEHAIVETARGLEFGEVAMGNSMVRESDTVPPLRPILRAATPADIKRHEENKKKEDEAFALCNERIISHKLDMKLIDAQYTFDNSKLLFYFTSSGRVDFRDLVKDLAGVFRTRIELRQIGIRDEAKIMGGVGMCGRPLCCTLFLSDFGQVSIKMAKEQNLSLNCAKISGIFGRLMCCLRYEHETYEYEIKRTPPVDSLVQTADGNGVVTEIHPLAGTLKVRLSASPENPPKLYKREDVVMLQKKRTKDASDTKDK